MEINEKIKLFKTSGVLGRGKSREVRKRRKERGIAADLFFATLNLSFHSRLRVLLLFYLLEKLGTPSSLILFEKQVLLIFSFSFFFFLISFIDISCFFWYNHSTINKIYCLE